MFRIFFQFSFFTFLFSSGLFAQSGLTGGSSSSIISSPVSFRKNMGQWDENILFRSSSEGWNAAVNFLHNGPSFCFSREANAAEKLSELQSSDYEHLVWNVAFKNTNKNYSVSANIKHESEINYFIGNNPSRYVTHVPEYNSIRYNNVYHNIDIAYYNKEGKLKYDLIVNPGGEINNIQFACEGITQLSINERKQMQIQTLWGTLIEDIPESYQIINGEKKYVEVQYHLLENNSYGFEITGKYNKNYALIIDPVVLDWSTYVGGTSVNGNGYLRDITADAGGNIYATGYYDDFMATTPGVYGPTTNGMRDVFVFKLNASGNTLSYCTYIGGTNNDEGWGISVNSNGEVVMTGVTTSNNFPTTSGAYDNTYNALPGQANAFVCELNATGTALLYSTYIGGQYIDWGRAINFSSAGTEAVICGTTMSANFPTTSGAFDNVGGVMGGGQGGVPDAFVSHIKLDNSGVAPDLSDLLYSSFIGGTSNAKGDVAWDLDINASGDVYITGQTNSTDLLTTAGAFSTVNPGADGFIYKMRLDNSGVAPDVSDLLYGTFIASTGGNGSAGYAIEVSPLGDTIFVAGVTSATNFPATTGAFQTALSAGTAFGGDLFVLKLHAGGNGATDLKYGTYIGGNEGEGGIIMGMAAALDGSVFVTAGNYNGGSPVTACTFDNSFNGPATDPAGGDVLLYKVNSTGGLDYGTYVGGAEYDYFSKVVLTGDACAQECVLGLTTHANQNTFPITAGSYQTIKNAGTGLDAPAILKFKPTIATGFTLTANPQCGVAVSFTDTTNYCGLWRTVSSWAWDFGDGTTASVQNPNHTFASAGTYNVKLKVSCPEDSITIPVIVSGVAVSASADTAICKGASAQLTAGTGTSYTWDPPTGLSSTVISNPIATPSITTTYTVTVSGGGCSDTAMITIHVDSLPLASISTDTTICEGSTVTLTASGGATYLWDNGSTSSSVIITPPLSSLYTSTVANGGCYTIVSSSVTVSPTPITSVVGNLTIKRGESSTLSGSGGGTYQWYPSGTLSCSTCQYPVATPSSSTMYYLLVTDANGCTALDSIFITVNDILCTGGNIFIPTAFSPNGDGQNDVLKIYGNCIENLLFQIYNRWGELIFESNDIKAEWNGYFKEKILNTGVYAYNINVVYKDGNSATKQGNISLLR